MITRLRELREHLGRTVAEHARALGVHPSNLYRIEAGTLPAGAKTQERFAAEFSVAKSELFDQAGWARAVLGGSVCQQECKS